MFKYSSFAKLAARNARFYTRYAKNDQIYIHEHNGRFAAAFSPNPDSLAIGYSKSTDFTPQDFEPEPKFLSLLNKTIHDKVHEDFTFIMEAGVNALTYMPIYDFRDIPRFARTPDVDNVFGYVLVDDKGKMVPMSFEPSNMYRLCNGQGLIKLSDFLYDQMKSESEPKQWFFLLQFQREGLAFAIG